MFHADSLVRARGEGGGDVDPLLADQACGLFVADSLHLEPDIWFSDSHTGQGPCDEARREGAGAGDAEQRICLCAVGEVAEQCGLFDLSTADMGEQPQSGFGEIDAFAVPYE